MSKRKSVNYFFLDWRLRLLIGNNFTGYHEYNGTFVTDFKNVHILETGVKPLEQLNTQSTTNHGGAIFRWQTGSTGCIIRQLRWSRGEGWSSLKCQHSPDSSGWSGNVPCASEDLELKEAHWGRYIWFRHHPIISHHADNYKEIVFGRRRSSLMARLHRTRTDTCTHTRAQPQQHQLSLDSSARSPSSLQTLQQLSLFRIH